MEFPNIFKGEYKLLAVLPLLMVMVSLYFIPQIKMGVDFTGGTLISLTLDKSIDAEQLETQLTAEGLKADVRVFDTAVGYKAEIEFPQSTMLIEAEKLKANFSGMLFEVSQLETLAETNSSYVIKYNTERTKINEKADAMFKLANMSKKASGYSSVNELSREITEAYKIAYSNYEKGVSGPIKRYINYNSMSIQIVSPVLSTHFLETATQVVIFAAALSIAFVFLFFRVFVPSVAVLSGALCDVIIAMGAMGLFGIPLTLPSFAALLMLIGFSLDTDILLTMRMLRRKGDSREKAHGAMKTGLTMSITAIIAFSVLFILATLTHIPTYYEISAVALAGLFGDMFATWGINAVLLLWHVEREEKRHGYVE
jgi:preprotein translocase subunit SecF